MIEEIGSLFWDVELDHANFNMFEAGHDSHYLLSGRTALDYIIKDIKKTSVLKSIYLPSYCCRSMIKPFIDNNIEVIFYDVVLGKVNGYKYNIDINVKCDAILLMQYFGFYCEEAGIWGEIYKEAGKVVIEDATHSIFSDDPHSQYADYVYASFRKWSGLIEGAVAIKMKGDFLAEKNRITNENHIDMCKKVVSMKKQYIEQNISDADEFLDLRRQAEELLYKNYQDYTISDESLKMIRALDVKTIKRNRQANAGYLIDALKHNEEICCIFNSVSDGDCPLYVPIHIAKSRRDSLKAYLVGKKIYCPTHWLLSGSHSISKDSRYMYENGLSLICDQRYNIDGMKRIIETIHDFQQIK